MAAPDLTLPVPPPPDPNDYQEYLQALRRAQMAQYLTQGALTPPSVQQPVPGGKYYQEARLSPLSGLLKLGQAYVARKSVDQSNQTNVQMMAKVLASIEDPNNPRKPGEPPALIPNPYNLPKMMVYNQWVKDPAKYAEEVAGPDAWRAKVLGSGSVGEAQTRELAATKKENMLSFRKGAPFMSTYEGVSGIAPDIDEGVSGQWAPGQQASVQPIANAPELAQQMQQARETGKTAGGIHELNTAEGGSKYMIPPNLYGGAHLTPALAGPQAPAAPSITPRQHFPLHQAVAPGNAPTPPGVTPGIWKNAPPRPTSTAIGTDPYLKGLTQKMLDKHVELVNKYDSESSLADQRIAFNNEALKVLSGANVGPLSEKINLLASKAHELGVPLPSWMPDIKTVNNSTELKKFLLRNPLLSLKSYFGGKPAASEFQILANEASPSNAMLGGAIQRLVQLDNQSAGFAKQRGIDYSYYHDNLQGNPQRFETWYGDKVPFAKWLDSHPHGREGEAHVDTRKPLSEILGGHK
jgi:hypothetical protein